MEEHRCSVCLTQPPLEPASVKECGHEYCLTCLQQWCRTRRAPKCPLCQAPVLLIVLRGQDTEVPPPDQLEEDGPDLGCLDHSYFRAESDRLLCRARAAQLRLAQSAYGCGRRGSRAAHDASDTLQQVIVTLTGYREDMSNAEVPFQAETVLHELYCLDQLVQSISAGGWAAGDGGALESVPSARFSAADAAAGLHEWREHSDSDYDCSDDDDLLSHNSQTRQRFDRALQGGTPGRRPMARRRGSSGSLTGGGRRR